MLGAMMTALPLQQWSSGFDKQVELENSNQAGFEDWEILHDNRSGNSPITESSPLGHVYTEGMSKGDNVRAYSRLTGPDSEIKVLYGVQNEQNYYSVKVDSTTAELEFVKISGGEKTILQKESLVGGIRTTSRLDIFWENSGDHRVVFWNDSIGSEFEVVDKEWASGDVAVSLSKGAELRLLSKNRPVAPRAKANESGKSLMARLREARRNHGPVEDISYSTSSIELQFKNGGDYTLQFHKEGRKIRYVDWEGTTYVLGENELITRDKISRTQIDRLYREIWGGGE